MQANRDLRQSPDPSIRHSIVVDASGGLMFPVGGVVRKGFSAHTAHLEMHRFKIRLKEETFSHRSFSPIS